MPALHDHVLYKFPQQLGGLDTWIGKAIEHAKQRDFDPDKFVDMRLAPDMFGFARQIQACCDIAKFAAARTAGKEAPKHEDNEKTLEELRARIKTTIEYIGTFKPEDIGPDDREIRLPFMEGKALKAGDYILDFAGANFGFHLTMAYAILRSSGVKLGKRDYLINMRFYDVES